MGFWYLPEILICISLTIFFPKIIYEVLDFVYPMQDRATLNKILDYGENKTVYFGLAIVYLFIVHMVYYRKKPIKKIADCETMEKQFEFKDKSEYRMMLVVRNDLKMGKGKIAAQCCHAAVMSYEAAVKKRPYLLKPWMKNGTAKIAVKVESEEELLEVEKKAKELKILSKIVRDAGHTQVAPMSRTVLSLGPAPKSVLDEVTGHLKLL